MCAMVYDVLWWMMCYSSNVLCLTIQATVKHLPQETTPFQEDTRPCWGVHLHAHSHIEEHNVSLTHTQNTYKNTNTYRAAWGWW